MTTSARAAVLETKDGPFEFRDIEIEDPRADEVLVRMVATGICAPSPHSGQFTTGHLRLVVALAVVEQCGRSGDVVQPWAESRSRCGNR